VSDLETASAQAGAAYDALPYESHPFPQMQPARLAGLAHLFGLAAPDVTQARVLEIGSAAGGHLIPLAARFPQARFLGIDPSRVQIEDGRARAAALGLDNLDLRAIGVDALGPEDGPFDYILCHGVYSWVPEAVRGEILRAIGDRLAPDGIAYVSYNVLPGWRMLQSLRDALIASTIDENDPRQRVGRARELLELMREGTDADSVWGQLWRTEATRLADATDDYLGHEFLEPDNAPCSFVDFIGAAGRHGLAYLAEAELFTMLPENVTSGIAPELRAFAGNKLVGVEQMLDLVNGRTFRQTLLVTAAQAGRIVRQLKPEGLAELHLVAPTELAADPKPDGDGTRHWRDEAGRSISTGDAGAGTAIDRLIANLPSSSTLADLVAGLDETGRAAAMDALFRMLTVGLIDPSTVPVLAAGSVSLRPRAFEVARRDAAAGLTSTANLRHEIVHLDDATRRVLAVLDGTREATALGSETLTWLARNALLES
jgi:SAM-dependent methyltransferase